MVAVAAYSPAPAITVNLAVAQVDVASPVITVRLPTGIWAEAYPLTAVVTPDVIKGGEGDPGYIRVTYTDPASLTLVHSIAGVETSDWLGNEVPLGYQGPISVQSPITGLVVTETWHTGSLLQCSGSGNGVDGFYYRLTPEKEVELIWDVVITHTDIGMMVQVPAAYIPQTNFDLRSGWYGNGPATYDRSYNPYICVFGYVADIPGLIVYNSTAGLISAISMFGRVKYTLE